MSMSRIIKPLSVQVAVTANNNVSNAVLVYVFGTNAAIVTVSDPVANAAIGSISIGLNDTIIIEKANEHFIMASAEISATSIKFRG